MGGEKSGVFPYNYVEPLATTLAAAAAVEAVPSATDTAVAAAGEVVSEIPAVAAETATTGDQGAAVEPSPDTTVINGQTAADEAAPAPAANSSTTVASLEPGNTGTLTTPSGKKSKKKKKDDEK